MRMRPLHLILLLGLQACVVRSSGGPPPPAYQAPAAGAAAYAPYPAGSHVLVYWKGSWYRAVVQQTNGDQSLVHYNGYDHSWDEWVGPNRIRATTNSAPPAYAPPSSGGFYAGQHVQVLWKGSWYPAVIIKASGSGYYVHYDGYGSNWDEWVGPNRVR